MMADHSIIRVWARSRSATANVVLLALGLLVLAPVWWMVSASLRPVSETMTIPPSWFPRHLDLANSYARLGTQEYPVLTFLRNSLVVSTVSTVGVVFTSTLAGYAFAKMRFRGRNVLFSMLLLALMVPIQVTTIPLYLIMQHLGLIDSLWALMLPALLGAFAPGLPGAFGIFMMRQFFAGTSDSLLESARIDGAGPWRIFFQIAVPLAKPAIASLAMIVAIFSWNDYFQPLIFLNSAAHMTLPVGIQSLRPAFGQGSSLVLASVTLATIPVLVIFIFGQRWIVQGFIRSGLNE
jgi:multiple sugar transport system permease protein